MAITGEGPGRPPVKVGAPVSDITAGIIAAMGILAAYTHRLKTGEGQLVDTSLFEAAISLTYWQSAICLGSGVSPGPMGSAHPLNAPYQAFEASDGWFNLGAANPANWQRLLDVLDAHELGEDPRFADSRGRITNRLELEEVLAPYFKTRTVAEWVETFEKIGLPAGPVLSIAEMHADPQTLAREMITEVEHVEAGPVKTIGTPVKFSETPGGPKAGAPLLGQHTREVLAEAGYVVGEVEQLIACGAVGEP
jgi:crotonobetainyl-CoA:carnitine CoA-transferase CaiB-like acyl-CoA transferase